MPFRAYNSERAECSDRYALERHQRSAAASSAKDSTFNGAQKQRAPTPFLFVFAQTRVLLDASPLCLDPRRDVVVLRFVWVYHVRELVGGRLEADKEMEWSASGVLLLLDWDAILMGITRTR